jgi:hypothetical protein
MVFRLAFKGDIRNPCVVRIGFTKGTSFSTNSTTRTLPSGWREASNGVRGGKSSAEHIRPFLSATNFMMGLSHKGKGFQACDCNQGRFAGFFYCGCSPCAYDRTMHQREIKTQLSMKLATKCCLRCICLQHIISWNMRITFEIDAKDLKQIQKITGQKKKSPAISRALTDYLQMRERRALIERALTGQTDYPLTNEELEARDVYETR